MNEMTKPVQPLVESHDYCAEGIALLTAEPSRLMRITILVLCTGLLVGLVWSFIGKVDVIVEAQGQLGPESRIRLVFSPVQGQLVDVFMSEGMPVKKGDVLARVNSLNAVEIATRALEADIQLRRAEEAFRILPAQKTALQGEVDALQSQIDALEDIYARQNAEGLANLADEQKLKLEKARLTLDNAATELQFAKAEWQKYDRLARSAGGGGIARVEVEERRRRYETALAAFELAKTDLGEFEVALTKEYARRKQELLGKSQELNSLYAQLAAKKVDIERLENEAKANLLAARAQAAGAARITFEDIDEDNFLLIKAPVSGVITNVDFLQAGAQIDAQKPVAGIAPENARTVLHVEIPERDRAFLREGMPVKLKFNAFPYQRHGFIDGTLEFISPDATAMPDELRGERLPSYRGRIGLERLYFQVDERQVPLRHGMAGTAEMVVRERRLIEYVLDPFGGLAG